MNSHEVFIHIHRGCFTGTGAIVRLPQCQWSKPVGYGKISQCITTTKHSKAKPVCIFLGIYCMQCNAIQCNAMQCKARQGNMQCTIYSTICNKIQYNRVQYNTIYNTMYNIIQCNTIQHNTIQHNLRFSTVVFHFTVNNWINALWKIDYIWFSGMELCFTYNTIHTVIITHITFTNEKIGICW